jgi:hypothetical protein
MDSSAKFRRSRAKVSRTDWAFLAGEFDGSELFFSNATLDFAVSLCKGQVAYLAAPFSRRAVSRDGAYDLVGAGAATFEASKWAGLCLSAGQPVLSSVGLISDMVAADLHGAFDPCDRAFWATFCKPLAARCDVVFVPPIVGWDESLGVFEAVSDALAMQKRVFLIRPNAGAIR